ncbi:SID1 transmembrane member 1 [Saguinus oedipus]|uniref:SID1 transmembrane member 1 n=1 Tax=Saguinus oedipus TaxID=9490 RepID=A0ABQ9U6F6_SAGOE|nr:SID1 transmembrane member 1 [Saguinus oedipus]
MPQCPVYDLDHNVEFNGVYQSMTKKAAITLQKKDFPGEQFFVVFVVKPEDYACGGSFFIREKENQTWNLQRTKNLKVTIVPSIKDSVYVKSSLFSVFIFLSFYLGCLLVVFVHYLSHSTHLRKQRKSTDGGFLSNDATAKYISNMLNEERDSLLWKSSRKTDLRIDESSGSANPIVPWKEPLLNQLFAKSNVWWGKHKASAEFGGLKKHGLFNSGNTVAVHPIATSTPEGSNYGTIDESSSSPGGPTSSPDGGPPGQSDTDSSVEESDFDTVPDVESDKNIIRTKMFLYLSDLSRKDRRIVSKKYKIYFWNIITIAVFYALPVTQLVITYQTVVNVTGNQDICYYNFLCAHPLGVLSAFNNILSNLGHVLLGFLFLLIVWRRDILHRRALEAKDIFAMEYGIPKHCGLFYAMGIALMMEGVLSACYHVCPNYSNFQFDTSFMYMIAGLCMLKLYQTRHPDINASAYSAYASFALVIMLTVLGVVFGKNDVWFWVIFSAIHVLASLALSTQIYYMGRFKIGELPVNSVPNTPVKKQTLPLLMPKVSLVNVSHTPEMRSPASPWLQALYSLPGCRWYLVNGLTHQVTFGTNTASVPPNPPVTRASCAEHLAGHAGHAPPPGRGLHKKVNMDTGKAAATRKNISSLALRNREAASPNHYCVAHPKTLGKGLRNFS